MTSEEVHKEKNTFEKIIEHIGPYGLIAFCATLLANILSKPMDYNSWVSIGIIGLDTKETFFCT